jgi:hypothetical protein
LKDSTPTESSSPIFNDPNKFRDNNKIKELPDKHRKVIESIQPYDGRYPGLWLLHELAREYRHRVLHTTGIEPALAAYHVLVNGFPIIPPDLERIPHERLKDGDILMRFTLDVDANASVHPQAAVTVGIDHPLARGLIGQSVINQIRNDTQAALDAMEPLLYA